MIEPQAEADRTVMDVDTFQQLAGAIKREVARVIVGQESVVHHTLAGILSMGHVLLEGVPGLGKTMLVRTLGQALQLRFSRIQFTPDLMPADITGTEMLDEAADRRPGFRFEQGPVFANLVLADEINRATPKTQSALLEAMQEHTVTAGKRTYPLPSPFFVLATQNPIEQEGTYPLPEAQLDRFMFKVDVPFPAAEDLAEILSRTTGVEAAVVESVASGEQILAMQALARQVPMPTHVGDYVSRLIVATHPGRAGSEQVRKFVRYGASPRGGQAMIVGAKVGALLDGRYNVSFDDIQAFAPAALRHRILLNFEGQADGIAVDDIVSDLLERLPENP